MNFLRCKLGEGWAGKCQSGGSFLLPGLQSTRLWRAEDHKGASGYLGGGDTGLHYQPGTEGMSMPGKQPTCEFGQCLFPKIFFLIFLDQHRLVTLGENGLVTLGE